MAGQNRAAGARRVAEETAAKAVALFGARRNIHPADALIELVQWTAGEVEFWREEVRRLADTDLDALTWGLTKSTTGEKGGDTSEAKPNVAYVMLMDASKRLEAHCVAALRAGVEERRVQIAEQTGTVVVDLFRRVFAELSLTTEQQAVAAEALPRHMVLLRGGAA
jgi:hypothetical protein